MAKTYLLTCECGATVAVGPGQAGGRTACPRCGAGVVVPRLGALEGLPLAAAPEAVAAAWTPAHACLLGGTAVAVLALVAAVLLSRGPRAAIDPAVIRSVVSEASVAAVYQRWQALERSGVARPPVPEEERMIHAARSSRAIGIVLGGVGLVAAAVAVGGWIALARRGKT